MSLTIGAVKKINAGLGCNLVDQRFLILFESKFHYDFLYQVHYIRGIKNQNQKNEFLESLTKQTNELLKELGRKTVSFKTIANSKKVTDYASLIREVLCRNNRAMKHFLDLRKQNLQSLKTKENPEDNEGQVLEAFQRFYEIVLQGNFLPTKKSMRTILTGIRKLFRQQPIKKKDKRERRKEKDLLKHRKMLYKTNRTIRDILEHCQVLNRNYENDQDFSNSVNILLQERRWMGPNLFKILLANKWKGYEIDTLIDLMNETLRTEAKFGDIKTQSMVKRTIVNMRTCSNFLKQHPNAANSYRFIATVSNWGSNHVFTIKEFENQMFMSNDGRENMLAVPTINQKEDSRDGLRFLDDSQGDF